MIILYFRCGTSGAIFVVVGKNAPLVVIPTGCNQWCVSTCIMGRMPTSHLNVRWPIHQFFQTFALKSARAAFSLVSISGFISFFSAIIERTSAADEST
jgi:hypothetical protein